MKSASQLELLRPHITERIAGLVCGRLLDGIKFFRNGVIASEFTRREVKLALLLVKIANPDECLTIDEHHIIEGRQKLPSTKLHLIATKARKPQKAKI